MLNEENISEFLKANSIKPSYQRLKIYQYLIDKKNHPSVDMIFKELVHKIPTLSRTTVYNTLKLFIEKNITSLLTIKENEARFDADVSLHGHFLCTKCGTIYDIAIDAIEKQIPMKVRNPIDANGKYNKLVTYCYSCGETVKNMKHCCNCGQRLDWSNN